MSSKRCSAAAAWRVLPILVLAVSPLAVRAQTSPVVSTVVSFSGSVPVGNLVKGADGALYGTTTTSSVVAGGLIYRAAIDGSSITTIHQIDPKLEGQTPQAGLLLASDGKFYGTTKFGKTGTLDTTGTIFRLAQDGTGFTILHRFAPFTSTNVAASPVNTDGAYPSAELVEGSDGLLYGITGAGGPKGTGAIFKIAKDGSGFQLLHTFSEITTTATDTLVKNVEGMSPSAPLVEGPDGKFYGTASAGGGNGRGTIFRINFDGSGFQLIHTFSTATADPTTGLLKNDDGATPGAGLIDGHDGLLYGSATQGGTVGHGVLFSISPTGANILVVLHNFDGTDGSRPAAELALFPDGKLYGTAFGGGTSSAGATTSFGTLFSIMPDGTFTKLYSFDSLGGSGPASQLLQLSGTVFVGTASGGGTCASGELFSYSSTGATVTGNTKCGRKKGSTYGGGSTGPGIVLLLGALGLVRPRRRRQA
jgi:uncharacterized repeat protein (TIGR03803 family)